MILTLLAVSLNDQALSRPISARFDEHGGSIGRADHCTLALPDPERFISRKQAEVVCTGEGFLIRNVGVANPVVVGGQALAAGESGPLRHGDEVRLGGYLLRVDFQPGVGQSPHALAKPTPPPARSATPTRPPVAAPPAYQPAPAPALSADNPFADLLGPSSASADPLGHFMHGAPSGVALSPAAPAIADPFAGLMAAPAGVNSGSRAVAAPAQGQAPAGQVLPDDFDPFASAALLPPKPQTGAAAHGGWATPSPVRADDPFGGLIPASGSASIDDTFGLSVGQGSDPLANFSADLGRPVQAQPGGLSTDPLALFGGSNAASNDWALPASAPALADAFEPPRLATPTPALARPPASPFASPSSPPSRAEAGDAEAQLWQAFCEGAGVRLPLPVGTGADRMQLLGRVTRSAIEGTLQLMAVRASTKHEMRAAVTQIQARSNNPLKFAPDAKLALEQLLQPPARGFLDGPAAMDDAMQDLVGHAIASVAGMRSAIEGMLDRFDPQALEAQLATGSMLENLLALNRRSRLWELYLQHHRAIREEAQEDFHKLFGKAFVAAYEQQVDRLKHKGPP